jgi:HK97 family phage major capsid protein
VQDDTANVGVNMNETAGGVELDPADASIALTPKLWSSKQFWYSNTMVLAQSFDVLSYTLPQAEKRIEKSQEAAWTTQIKAGTVGKVAASSTTVTYQELLDWEHSLLPAYRTDAAFVVSDALYRVLRGLTDTQARPILDQDPTNVFAGKIHGKPVIVCDSLDPFGTNKIVGAFVSADALKIVDILNARIVRYVLVPGKPDQVGFELFQNGDFGFVSKGVSLLETAAS